MKAGVLLLVAMAELPGCAPMAEVDQSAPQAAAPQPLLPETYAAPPAAAASTATPPPSPIYAVAPARGRSGLGLPATMFNLYHPQWTVNVQ